MFRKPILIAALLLISLGLLAVSACSTQVSADSSSKGSTVKQVTIKAELVGNSVSIPLSEVEKNTNTRFLVNTATDQLSFMAYKYDKQLYVRADICPPCGSKSFTLTNGTLVCDSCGTVFNAKTGIGIKGACVKFAKQAVTFENKDGTIFMKGQDLTVAFQNTLNPKK